MGVYPIGGVTLHSNGVEERKREREKDREREREEEKEQEGKGKGPPEWGVCGA